MFGSKNKQQKIQANISVETMEDNIKGENAKALAIEYNTENIKSDVGQNSTQDSNIQIAKDVPKSSGGDNQKAIFKAPFGNDNSSEKVLPKNGTFSNASEQSTTLKPEKIETLTLSDDIKNAKNPEISIDNTTKGNDSTFLHQAIDEKINNNNNLSDKDLNNIETKKNKSMTPIIFIIVFILLLAGIMYGGYYFYMHQSPKKPKQENTTQDEKNNKMKDNAKKQANETINGASSNNEIQKPEKIKYKIGPLITSPTTFNDDLAKFVLSVKQNGDKTTLQNGILIDVVKPNKERLLTGELLEALHMTDFFDPTVLKEACKLFVVDDLNNIKIGVVFELTEIADEKIIREKIIQKEGDLMKKMSYLFVDGVRPVVPAEVTFAVNKINMGARYANYTPGVDTTSVDWNILDLGKGRILYFVTSRKVAKILTEYLMRVVVK